MNFEKALDLAKRGRVIRLSDWSKELVVKVQFPDKNSKMTTPYLYIEDLKDNIRSPLVINNLILFSENWEEYIEENEKSDFNFERVIAELDGYYDIFKDLKGINKIRAIKKYFQLKINAMTGESFIVTDIHITMFSTYIYFNLNEKEYEIKVSN